MMKNAWLALRKKNLRQLKLNQEICLLIAFEITRSQSLAKLLTCKSWETWQSTIVDSCWFGGNSLWTLHWFALYWSYHGPHPKHENPKYTSYIKKCWWCFSGFVIKTVFTGWLPRSSRWGRWTWDQGGNNWDRRLRLASPSCFWSVVFLVFEVLITSRKRPISRS